MTRGEGGGGEEGGEDKREGVSRSKGGGVERQGSGTG